jgi:hypothetical protein
VATLLEKKIDGKILMSEQFDENMQKELIPIGSHRAIFQKTLENLKYV